MKRFTETEKWRDVWYRKLTPVQKCLWHYLVDNCDSAGVIDLDVDLASFQIGEQISERDLKALAKGIDTLPGGKLWVRAFVRFQFGQLSEACAPHKQVFAALKKHGIEVSTCYETRPQTLSEPLAKGSLTLKDKDKDKDKDKVQDKDRPVSTAEQIYALYPRKEAKQAALKAIAIALKKVPAERLIDRVTAYAAAVSRWPAERKQYVPLPATWLNAGRWDDDPAQWEDRSRPVVRSPFALTDQEQLPL